MELKELLCALEERLVQHDNNRKEIQSKVQVICNKLKEGADSLEERISKQLQNALSPKEERILNLIEKLNNREGKKLSFIKQAREELSNDLKCEIQHIDNGDNFTCSYKLKVTSMKNDPIFRGNDPKIILYLLHDRLNRIHETANSARDKIAEICTKRRNEAEVLEVKINEKLESFYVQEDSRIQEAVNCIKEKSNENVNNEELITKARSTLFINQKYSLNKVNYELIVTKELSLKKAGFKKRKPSNVISSFTDKGEISLSFSFFSDDEINVLKTMKYPFNTVVKMWEKNKSEEEREEDIKTITKEYNVDEQQICFAEPFYPSTVYCLKVRIECSNGSCSQWSDEIEFTASDFSECVWKKCPDYVDEDNKYTVDENNPRIATKINNCGWRTITGNISLPINKVTSWNIKILKSKDNDRQNIFIGVAPFDINQNEDRNFEKCGWYFHCFNSKLWSGPPHNHVNKKYGPRKKDGEYVKTGDSVGIIMDTTNGEISFVLNNVNLGVAFEGIPLDKPLVPCVILGEKGDSVELDPTSEVKEKTDSSIPVPSNITIKGISWDSITLTWDPVDDDASFYQIEVDGSKKWDATTTNKFTKRGLLEESEHSFRVRAVKDNSVSEWSDIVVKGRTMKAPDFTECVWKECPDDVDDDNKYSVDENNSRIASRDNDAYGDCTIIGNTFLHLNEITSWNIKVLKIMDNDGGDDDDGRGILIGVAPFDVIQNADKTGWYYYSYDSSLFSGPPHNYRRKEYGPRKEKKGEYVHTGDTVGLVMDTTKGDLSFVLNGVNYGVAYEGIPLDKPIVPCVCLFHKDDSVELII